MANHNLSALFRVKPGARVRLRDHDPAWTGAHDTKEESEQLLQRNLERLTQSQELLWASESYSLLIVLQAMDTAGKDGLIKHVMSGMNPQSCYVVPFKQPSSEELAHDFLWRYAKNLPARGHIGIFNRSHYEEVLVVRVHPEWIEKQRLGKPGRALWKSRYEDINNFEKHLARNRTVILKFFLNLSKKEQKKRLLARLDDPTKHWKFSPSDLAERAYWDAYMEAYQDALSATSTGDAPWFIVPADHKWVTRWVVSEILAETIKRLDLSFPDPTKEQRAAIKDARRALKRS